MSRDWTPEEIQAVSREMKKAGHMSFEEFCEELDRGGFTPTDKKEDKTMEDNFVYHVAPAPDPDIEGLKEIGAAYQEAQRWISSTNPVKVRLGYRAMDKLQNGENPDAVLDYMSRGLEAFNLAQEG